MTAEQALHDLTLTLIYLTRFTESKSTFFSNTSFQAWKNYNWNTLDELDEEGLISSNHRSKSLWITEDGVKRAREIMKELGIEDWKAEDVK